MRFHYSFQVSRLLRELKEEGAPIRRMIESLRKNPFPEDAYAVKGYVGRYEIFVAGYWLIYEMDRPQGETVLRVAVLEKN